MKIYVVTIIAILILPFYGCFNCKDYLNDKIKPLSIQGKVLKKYKNKTGCFGDIVLVQGTRTDTLVALCYCGIEEKQLWDYAEPNDSLYKPVGSLIVTVIREGVKTEFNYPCCSQ